MYPLVSKLYHIFYNRTFTGTGFLCIVYPMIHKKAIFEFYKVCLSYDGEHDIFVNLNMVINAGGFYVVTGPSGAGKTSLLRMMLLDILPSDGQIKIFGKLHTQFTHTNVVQIRQHMGFVFQDFKLLAHMTAYQNIALALQIRNQPNRHIHTKVQQILAWVGMEKYADSYPSALSGGQQQLLALARAVVTRPQVLVADEPTGSLDVYSASRIFQLFKALHAQGTTIVMVTHDDQMIQNMSYNRMHIHHKIVQEYPYD